MQNDVGMVAGEDMGDFRFCEMGAFGDCEQKVRKGGSAAWEGDGGRCAQFWHVRDAVVLPGVVGGRVEGNL